MKAVLLVVVSSAALFAGCTGGGEDVDGDGDIDNSGGGFGSQTYTQNLVNGLISVDAGEYNTYQFSVPSGAGSGSVSGSFSASGGSGNDIRVFIFDEMNYINWQNGHQVEVYYQSGQTTVGNIAATLPAGTFYLVYDNTFSYFSQKDVDTAANLQYAM